MSSSPLVLVVDDDRDTRELYRMVLETVGYRVAEAATVSDAASLAPEAPPDLVVTDWRLPDGTGLSVARAIQASAAARFSPLMVLSGVDLDANDAAVAREHGCVAFLQKPVLPDEFVRFVGAGIAVGTSKRLRAAAVRTRRYARHVQSRMSAGLITAEEIVARAAARSDERISLLLADDSARYVAASAGAPELTGYEPADLLKLSVWDLTPAPDEQTAQALWSNFMTSGVQEGRYRLRRRNGQSIDAQYCSIANVVPGLHISALVETPEVRATL
jgi:PAS domain S-box-containing protein